MFSLQNQNQVSVAIAASVGAFVQRSVVPGNRHPLADLCYNNAPPECLLEQKGPPTQRTTIANHVQGQFPGSFEELRLFIQQTLEPQTADRKQFPQQLQSVVRVAGQFFREQTRIFGERHQKRRPHADRAEQEEHLHPPELLPETGVRLETRERLHVRHPGEGLQD